jgi:hypothetical protein
MQPSPSSTTAAETAYRTFLTALDDAG